MRGRSGIPLKEGLLLVVLVFLFSPVAYAQTAGFVPGGGAVLAPTMLEEDKCFECHSDSSKVEDTSAADEWANSVHAENDIGCERCHSASVPAGRLAVFDVFGGSYRDDHTDLILDASIDYKSPDAYADEDSIGEYSFVVKKGLENQQAVAVCARCHGLTPLTPESPKNVFPDYISSVHGQSVVVKGLGDPNRIGKTEVDFTEVTGTFDSPTCADCHDSHLTLSKDDPTSESYVTNVPATCSTEKCHGGDELKEKYDLGNSLKTFMDTHHGVALRLGRTENVPSCAECHGTTEGTHRILAEDDPNSGIHPDNRAKICANEDCHGVEFNVRKGSMHGKDNDHIVSNLIDLFYYVVVGGAVIFFGLYVILDFTLLLGKKGGK